MSTHLLPFGDPSPAEGRTDRPAISQQAAVLEPAGLRQLMVEVRLHQRRLKVAADRLEKALGGGSHGG